MNQLLEPEFPLISIITVVYNGEKYIEQTILSVLEQSYKNIEYIIIDGQSTDNTLEIIKKYKQKIDLILSEPDTGISDAMNKGVINSHGKYVLFIHSDDYLNSSSSLESISDYVSSNYDVITCGILFGKNREKITPKGFTPWINLKFGNPHQGILCKKELFNCYGMFDCNFKIDMDYDFFLRIYRRGIRAVKVPIFLSVMRDTGISSQRDWTSLKIRFSEEKQVHLKNAPNILVKKLYDIYWFFYWSYRLARCYLVVV